MKIQKISSLQFRANRYDNDVKKQILFSMINSRANTHDSKTDSISSHNNFNNVDECAGTTNNIKSKSFVSRAAFLGVGALCVGIAGVLAFNKIYKIEPAFDVDYKKALLDGLKKEGLGIDSLKSICGKEEFLDFLNHNQNNPEIFRTGEKLQNVKDGIFGANMHLHTTHSDGQMTIKELLDISSGYADKYFRKNNKPFFIGITDHNTVTGCREAIEIISDNPEKYKNLRVVLGAEVNAVMDDTDIHTLIYGINPYKGKIVGFFDNQLASMQNGVKQVIKKSNSIYKEILQKYKTKFSFEDMAKIRQSIKTSPASVNYSMKDYMQFRLIYSDLVEGNPRLVDALGKNNVSLDDLDFSIPKFNIPQTNLKEPYYLNYIDELKKYILETVKGKSTECDVSSIEKCFKGINPDIQNVLNELEYKTIASDQPLYIKPVRYENLDNVLEMFKEENCPCGIAHPCLTYYAKGGARDDSIETRNVIKNVFEKFHNKDGLFKRVYEGEYGAYYPDKVSEEYKDFAKKLGREKGFLTSGSYDSHRNNPFTNELNLSKSKIEELIN